MQNDVNNVRGVMVLVFCMSSDMFYISIKFHESISKDFRVIEQLKKLQRGNNSINNVFVFCMSANQIMLNLTKFSENISKVFRVIDRSRFSN